MAGGIAHGSDVNGEIPEARWNLLTKVAHPAYWVVLYPPPLFSSAQVTRSIEWYSSCEILVRDQLC